MSNTSKKYEPRPYFNVAVLEELDREDQENAAQNPTEKSGQNSADSDTQKNNSATSDNSSEATYEKRWKDLKKHYDEEVTKLRRQLQDMEEKAQPTFKPPKTAEDIESFKKQYPEFYDVMLSVAYEQAAATGDASGSRIRKLEEQLMRAEQERALAEIEKAHPDYVTLVQTPEFLQWLEVQNSAIQSWVKENSTDASLFVRALDLFKLDSGVTKQMPARKDAGKAETKKTVDTSAAEDVRVSGNTAPVGDTDKRVWSRSEIGKLSAKEWEKHEEEIMQAYAEGRISDK